MTNFTEAARCEATVRLSDGTEIKIFYNAAGQNGWIDDVIGGYDPLSDDVIYWDLRGRGLGHNDNIMELVG